MIPVTKPYFPPKQDLDHYLGQIWEAGWMTNDGPLLRSLEERLIDHLKVPSLKAVVNGTLALQIAIRELGLKGGEVITTPFSYVATTSSLVWEGCTPVFVDIDPTTWGVDPERIEAAIGPNTKGILATHVFGNPCDVERIDAIAKAHGLKVIYDAAHAFDVEWKGGSVLNFGDASVLSFHATKLFHTVEGGAVVTPHAWLDKRVFYARNFGHDGPENFNGVGINAKLSEFHAAMGHAVLDRIRGLEDRRKEQWLNYDRWIDRRVGERLQVPGKVAGNYSYFPLLLPSAELCERLHALLDQEGIGTRRYFHPLLSDLHYISSELELPVARDISERVLCLPLYHELEEGEQEWIAGRINEWHGVTEKEE